MTSGIPKKLLSYGQLLQAPATVSGGYRINADNL